MAEIEDIETFNVVAAAGGLSPAARRLGVSKSIVSRRLARLEAHLGVRLFARSTRGAGLTEAGMGFRDHAARIATEMDTAREELTPTGELCGRFRVAAPLSLGPTHIAPLLAQLAKKHPRLQLHTAYSDRLVSLADEGFDAAIRIGYLKDSNLIARRIGPSRAKAVASPAYIAQHGAPNSLDELLSHEVLMQGTEMWAFIYRKKMIPVRPQGRFKADNGMALAGAAVAGLGVACLPDFLTDEHIASGALVPVMTRYTVPEGGVFLVYPSGGQPSRKIQALTELLVERFGEKDGVVATKRT
jgi:DNA-binding transcriptional LysR family regulator